MFLLTKFTDFRVVILLSSVDTTVCCRLGGNWKGILSVVTNWIRTFNLIRCMLLYKCKTRERYAVDESIHAYIQDEFVETKVDIKYQRITIINSNLCYRVI